MNKQKMWISILASTLCVSAIAGCSSEPASKTTKGETSKNEKVELSFSFWGSPEEKDSYTQLFENFTKIHPNITIKPIFIPDDYNTKLNAMASSNQLPDVAKIQIGQVFPWAKSKKFVDLAPIHNSNQIGKKLDYVGARDSSGKVIGYSQNNEIITLYYNKDIFDEAKVPYPPDSADKAWTWDDFVKTAKLLTKDRSGKHPGDAGFDPNSIETYGVNMTLNYNNLQPFLYSNGGGIVSPKDGTFLLNKPESIEAIQAIGDLANKHNVMPKPSQSSTVPAADTALLTKRVAMVIDGQWSLQVLAKTMNDKGLKLGMGVLPKFKQPVTVNTGSVIEILQTENTKKHMAEAQEFYKFIMDPENSFQLIETGLAMPNEEKWFKEPELIKKWVENKYHPKEYKTAVVDYGLNNVVQLSGYFWEDDTKAQTIIMPPLDQVWLGKKSAQEVVNNDIVPKLKQEITLK